MLYMHVFMLPWFGLPPQLSAVIVVCSTNWKNGTDKSYLCNVTNKLTKLLKEDALVVIGPVGISASWIVDSWDNQPYVHLKALVH